MATQKRDGDMVLVMVLLTEPAFPVADSFAARLGRCLGGRETVRWDARTDKDGLALQFFHVGDRPATLRLLATHAVAALVAEVSAPAVYWGAGTIVHAGDQFIKMAAAASDEDRRSFSWNFTVRARRASSRACWAGRAGRSGSACA